MTEPVSAKSLKSTVISSPFIKITFELHSRFDVHSTPSQVTCPQEILGVDCSSLSEILAITLVLLDPSNPSQCIFSIDSSMLIRLS